MAEQIGTYHLADNAALYEIARSNNFEFVINFDGDNRTDPLLKAGVSNANPDDADYIELDRAIELARLSVTKSSIPHFTQNVIEVKRGNSVMKAAGVPTFSEGSLVVNDFIGARTKDILMAWQRLSYDVRTEKVGRMSDYKRDCELLEYTPDYELVRRWVLKGCWISGISEGEYDMENGDKRQITATVQYDKAWIEAE